MWSIIAALGLGFACGLLPGADRWRSSVSRVSTAGLLALLVGMGVGLGSNETVMSGLASIGFAASIFSLLTILGSVLLLLPLVPWLRAKQLPQEHTEQL